MSKPLSLTLCALIALSAPPALALPIETPDKKALVARLGAMTAHLNDLPPSVSAAFVVQEDFFFWDHTRAKKSSPLTAMAMRLWAKGRTANWRQASPLEKENAIKALTETATPEQILTIYLNLIPLGADVIGLTAGAKTYFDKRPQALTPAEAAFLAVVAGSPEIALKPANQNRTKSQRDHILRQMNKAGALTDKALEEQLKQPMPEL